MKILSHRGYWGEGFVKNSLVAFNRSKELGFGTETDVRDCLGKLVISHDMPCGQEITFEKFLSCFSGSNLPLAINIKADGLAQSLRNVFKDWPTLEWFVFDMSIPDMMAHIRVGNPVFTRLSDVETELVCIEEAVGVWVDGFSQDFMDTDQIESLFARQKKICFVSSELHGRPHLDYWQYLSRWQKQPLAMLCTDLPEEARNYFGESI